MYSGSEIKGGPGLVTVSDAFFCYVTQCESQFNSLFDSRGHEPGVLHMIVNELLNCRVPVDCDEFPKLLFLKYFVRMRIFYKLKFYNRSHCACTKKDVQTKLKPRKNRKLAKIQHV